MDLSFRLWDGDFRNDISIVSILVLMDLSFRHTTIIIFSHHMWFQSLFWWICHFDQWMCFSTWPQLRCFNPCFDGFVISTHVCWQNQGKKGVSILVLMDLSFRPGGLSNGRLWQKFQSLFWWICHFDYCSWIGSIDFISFNPCFDGFVISTSSSHPSSP